MKTTAYRNLDKLNPVFLKKVTGFLQEVNKSGEVIFITESWRSAERQKELRKLGLSKVARSNHQDGLAIDIGFRGLELYPKDDKQWRMVANIAKKHGIDWGYDLWKWDRPHFQNSSLPITTITMKSKYSDIMIQELKESNLTPLFSSHEGDKPLTEREVKELIEIALVRDKKR